MHNMPHTEAAKEKMRMSHVGIPQLHKRRPILTINGDKMYRCGSCGGFFIVSEFYKDKRTILGLKNQCKSCHMKTSINSRDKENARKINKLYMRRAKANNPEKFKAIERTRIRPKDEKYVARRLLNYAVKHGSVVKLDNCQNCGIKTKHLSAHHHDYSKPLDVKWLCYECHGKHHRNDFNMGMGN